MKYRHAYHAGNFADVHKHITLLALLAALKRKDKGFLYLDTHAGRGAYDLTQGATETQAGVARFSAGPGSADELQQYAAFLSEYRLQRGNAHAYPGSPLMAAHELRPQDRAVLIELVPTEARALELALGLVSPVGKNPRVRVEPGDGFDRLRAWLPPPERRGLVLIDPPYEETSRDYARVTAAIAEALRRFQTGIIAVWYPIKEDHAVSAWQSGLIKQLECETLAAELWLYPHDSRVTLNGSGMLIVNPPYLLADRMRVWLPELQTQLDTTHTGGTSIRTLTKGIESSR
jgi:23S rRNA (adenine2030-N6)-methyltransferase